jgi:hypothetical protein
VKDPQFPIINRTGPEGLVYEDEGGKLYETLLSTKVHGITTYKTAAFTAQSRNLNLTGR